MMSFYLQPEDLGDNQIYLRPLSVDDFELLYQVASDPEIWEQHPTRNRYERDVFLNFFEGALNSGGAFIIYDQVSNEPIGSSRFYDYDESGSSILIGYTFLAKKYWGTNTNASLKKLMLDYAFKYVSKVFFHVGKVNIRSLNAMEKLGAARIGEAEIAYAGEAINTNVIFVFTKQQWIEKDHQK